jgi:ABC-type transporter Mla MlaB component
MLRITAQSDGARRTLVLEGKLAGPWVEEAERVWREAPPDAGRATLVRLVAVTFVDDAGRALLAEMHRGGAVLVAEGCMTRAIVEEIKRGEKL